MPSRGHTATTRIADRVIAALVGGPVRAVLVGALVIAALGSWLGWWWMAVTAGAALAETVWSARRLPARWRPW